MFQRAFKPKHKGGKLYDVLKAQKASAQMDMQRMPPSCGASFSATGLLVIFTNRALVSASTDAHDGLPRRGLTGRQGSGRAPSTSTATSISATTPSATSTTAAAAPHSHAHAQTLVSGRSRGMLLPQLRLRPVATSAAPADAAVITDSRKRVPGKVELIDTAKLTLVHRPLCYGYQLMAERSMAHVACSANAELAR